MDSQLGPPGLPESAKKKNFISRIQVQPHDTRTIGPVEVLLSVLKTAFEAQHSLMLILVLDPHVNFTDHLPLFVTVTVFLDICRTKTIHLIEAIKHIRSN